MKSPGLGVKGYKSVAKATGKGGYNRFAELFHGKRVANLEDAVTSTRSRGQAAARGHYKSHDARAPEVADRVLARADALHKEMRREHVKHLATLGGTLALGTAGLIGAMPLDPAGHRPKRKTASDKIADAARKLRLAKAVQAGLKAKNVIHAAAPKIEAKAPGAALTLHSGHHLTDEVIDAGSKGHVDLENRLRAQASAANDERTRNRIKRKQMGKRGIFDPGPQFRAMWDGRGELMDARHKNEWRVGPGAIAIGGVGGTGILVARDQKRDERKRKRQGQKKVAADKAKGFKRFGELLSGSRLKALRAEPGRDALKEQLGQAGAELAEQAKVIGTRTGAGVTGVSGAAGGAVAIHKHKKEKVATEEQVRSDARRAAGRTGMLRAGPLGAALGHLQGKGAKGTALGTAAGALLGRAHGRASFNKRELANDLHMERALIKAKRDRHDKEKKAHFELTDEVIDALYGL